MVDVLHLVDDPALGGVNRVLDTQLPHMPGEYIHERRIVRTIRNIPPFEPAKVVCVHFTVSWAKLPYLIALRRQCAGRLVLVEHSYTGAYEAHCVPDKKRFRRMLRLAYGLFDQVVAVSYGQAAWLRSADLVPFDRLTTIRQCLDLTAFLNLPLPRSHSGPLRLGAFGRFHRQKGFDLLIDAMRQISPSEAQLQIAGYGEDEDSLREAAADLPHVTIGGRVDPAAFLSQLDVVVMPSRWEAGAVTCWEVRASGRSIIVSAVDGLPEQVSPDLGIVVPPNDRDSIASAIRQLAGADRRHMAIQARASTTGAFERSLAAWAVLLEEPKAATCSQTRRRSEAIPREGYMGRSA